MNVAENEAFRLSVQNTARFLLISVPLLFLVSLLLAYYINTQIVRKGLVKAVLLFPMILPVSTTTLFCRILFDNAGILNEAFQKLGMDTIRLMDTGSVFWVLVALYFWKNIGFCVVLWSAAMEAIPKEIFEAARLDGVLRRTPAHSPERRQAMTALRVRAHKCIFRQEKNFPVG